MVQKESKESQNKENDEKENRLYELGFHILATLSEEEALSKYKDTSVFIEKNGGEIKLSQNPQPRALAYEITRKGAGKKELFNSSFFGSIIFEIESSKIEELQKGIKKFDFVLRFLLIEVPKEVLSPKERHIPQSHREEVKRATEKKDSPIDEATIDKAIEELVVE